MSVDINDEETRDLVKKTLALTEENNRILRGIRSSARWGRFFSIVWWIIIIAVIAILGNMEKTAIIISIPFIIEFFLKIRAKLRAHSYGYYKDGKIQSYYANIYSIPHIFSRTGRFTEKQITYFIICIEVIFSSLIWLI